MDGLTIKDGRLINERPAGITGIQHAANIKRGMRSAKKVEQIAEGVAMADSIKEMKVVLHKAKKKF